MRYEVRCGQCRLHEITTHERCVAIAATHRQASGHSNLSITPYGTSLPGSLHDHLPTH